MKNLSFLLGALTAWVAAAEVPVGGNVILNGRWACDQTDAPQFWTVDAGLIAAGNIVFTPSGGPGGLPSMKVSAAETNVLFGVVARQFKMRLAAGERYRLSCRVRTRDFSPVGKLTFAVVNEGWRKAAGLQAASFPRTTGWTTLAEEFDAPSSKNGLYSFCFHVPRLTGVLELADLRLEPLTEKARLGAAPTEGAEAANCPRLIPWRPRLSEIPSDTRTVEFRLCGVLPEGTSCRDYALVVRPEDASSAVRVPLEAGDVAVRLPEDAKGGRLALKVEPVAGGKPIVDEVRRYAVVAPAVRAASAGRELNVLVTELVNAPAPAGAGTFRFALPRAGWVFVSAGGGTARLDGQSVIDAATPRHETFRELAGGEHTLEVTDAKGAVVVRRIPEILNYPIGVDNPVPENPPYDWAFAERYVLPATTTQDGGTLTDAQAALLHSRGGKWLANQATFPLADAADLVSRLRASKGMTKPCYDGVSCDEQFFLRAEHLTVFTEGLKTFDLGDESGRPVYVWIVGKATSGGLDRDFIATCANASRGRGRMIAEVYCRTQPTEDAARDYLRDYVKGTATSFAAVYPDALRSLGIVLGNYTQVPVISLAWHPEVDFKYYLDMQLNLIVNDPAFRGLGCVGYWGSYYSDEEQYRWSMALLRHYLVEGNRTMLSEKYGYAYQPGHLVNGDFRGSFEGWTKTGDVTLDSIAKFGARSEGRWGGAGELGDTFAVLKRGAGAGNVLKQTVRGLKPGAAYCLQAAVFDVRDAKAAAVRPVKLPIAVRLGAGAERIDRLSWVHVDRRPVRKGKKHSGEMPRINLHRLVFRAKAATVEVSFDDTAAAPGTELGVNYVSVKPYFEDPEPPRTGTRSLVDGAYPASHVDLTDAKAVREFKRDLMERISDFALEPPTYIQHPGDSYGGKYSVTNLDYCMSGTIAVTKKGRIWVGWFSGGDSPLGFFCAARSDDGGKTWSGPEFVIDPHDRTLPLPRFTLCADLWVDPKGRLHVFHDQTMGAIYEQPFFMRHSSGSDSRRGVWHAVCEDPDAETLVWSKPERICDGNCLNKPLVAADGTWLLPIARGIHGGQPFKDAFQEICEQVKGAWLFASTDEGMTWRFRGGVRYPGTVWFEHMAYETRDGRLRMFARSHDKGHGIYESYSSDGGRTWTPPAAASAVGINGPCSRFHVRRLKSGNLLFLKHGDTMDDDNRGKRNNLRAFLSKDDGKTWLGGLLLDERGCSYPDAYETDDGAIHLVYDYERSWQAELLYARITEADILAKELVSPNSVLKVRAFKGFRNHMKVYRREHAVKH